MVRKLTLFAFVSGSMLLHRPKGNKRANAGVMREPDPHPSFEESWIAGLSPAMTLEI
jgi:hypothetical protein